MARPATRHTRRGAVAALGILLLVVVLVGAAGAYFYFFVGSDETDQEFIFHTVARGPFSHIVLEQGEIESSKNVEVICEVESRNSSGTAILWVITEGEHVKAGDKLVELDSSALEEELKQQRVIVNTSGALKISADSALEQALVAKEEYQKGTFVQEEKQILRDILLAEESLSRAEEAAKFSRRLAAQGFKTKQQLKADLFAVESAKVSLDLEQNKLKTLREITKRKMEIGFDSDIESARARAEAEASSHEEEITKLAEVEEQIIKCVIVAPEDGQVVHANRYSSRGGSAEFVVEAGATVRERQAIIRLPDPTNMQVKAKINESQVPLVSSGMPVRIKVGAFDEGQLEGRVKKVNKYAEPSSWWSSQVKEYGTFIEIVNPTEEIRTGMTAEISIFVDQQEDVLQVPVQAIHEYRGHVFCLVHSGANQFETREITIGASNDKQATIVKGLDENDQLVMNPRKHIDLMQLPDLPEPKAGGPTAPGGGVGGAVTGQPAGGGQQADAGKGRGPRGGGQRGKGGKAGGKAGGAGKSQATTKQRDDATTKVSATDAAKGAGDSKAKGDARPQGAGE